jgi:hypothetical protein
VAFAGVGSPAAFGCDEKKLAMLLCFGPFDAGVLAFFMAKRPDLRAVFKSEHHEAYC